MTTISTRNPIRTMLRCLATAFAFASLAAPARGQGIDFNVSDSDGNCPAGFQLATSEEARANQQAACSVLGTWYIARLSGGGSMDGPGYGCKIRDEDTRPLGNSLCRRSAGAAPGFSAADGDGTCPSGSVLATAGEARSNPQAACSVLGTWYIARLAGGGSMDGPGYGCKIRDEDTRPLGNSLCRSGTTSAYGDTSECIVDTLTPSLNAQGNSGAWVQGNITFAERQSFSAVEGGFANPQFTADAAQNYCGQKGYGWSLAQFEAEVTGQHLDVQCCSRLTPQNSSTPANVSEFVQAAIANPAAVDEITASESLDDIYDLAKELGHPVTVSQLDSIAATLPSKAKRSAHCGGYDEPGCEQCASTVTVYFPFNFCCIPIATSCVSTATTQHCDPGLTLAWPNGRSGTPVCRIDRSAWNEVPIDPRRSGSTCGPGKPINCWKQDDLERDQLEMDTSKLNFVTTLGPDNATLPEGTRFIYVYRKSDDRIVLRNYDRNADTYMFPGNCRSASDFGVYACTTSTIANGRYLHVRHTQLNHAPGTAAGNNWDPVWCAGEMRIENGKICRINNESGHFKPPPACIDNVTRTLQAWRVPMSDWINTKGFDRNSAANPCEKPKDEL